MLYLIVNYLCPENFVLLKNYIRKIHVSWKVLTLLHYIKSELDLGFAILAEVQCHYKCLFGFT